MIMTLNEILTRQNVFTKLILKDEDKEIPKELKVKIMRIRMAYNKVKKNFDNETKEFTDELITQEFKTLSDKIDRTTEEEERLKELTNSINSEYQEFLIQKGNEMVDIIDDSLTEEEYADILEVNINNDVEINGNKIAAVNFLEIVYDLFVK